MEKGFSDALITPCPLAPMQSKGRGNVTPLSVLDLQLPMLQLLLQITYQQQGHVWRGESDHLMYFCRLAATWKESLILVLGLPLGGISGQSICCNVFSFSWNVCHRQLQIFTPFCLSISQVFSHIFFPFKNSGRQQMSAVLWTWACWGIWHLWTASALLSWRLSNLTFVKLNHEDCHMVGFAVWEFHQVLCAASCPEPRLGWQMGKEKGQLFF